MPSKSRKLAPTEIAAFEATRDIGAEILQAIKDMKKGKGQAVVSATAADCGATQPPNPGVRVVGGAEKYSAVKFTKLPSKLLRQYMKGIFLFV